MDLDFPIALRLKDRPVLVVGAGKIAEGRIQQLLEVGALVHVIAPEATEALKQNPAVRLSLRPYRPGDCAGAFVVFTASDDRAVNEAVVQEARERGILVNAADAPALCDFYVPSIGRSGPVTVAVSTSGQAPSLSRVLRRKIMEALGTDAGRVATMMGRLRKILPAGPERTELFNALAEDTHFAAAAASLSAAAASPSAATASPSAAAASPSAATASPSAAAASPSACVALGPEPAFELPSSSLQRDRSAQKSSASFLRRTARRALLLRWRTKQSRASQAGDRR